MAIVEEQADTAVFKYQSPSIIDRFAIIGTSLVQQCNEANISTGSERVGVSTRSWFDWANIFLNNAMPLDVYFDDSLYAGWGDNPRGFWGRNFGVSGQTAAEIKARLKDIPLDSFDTIIVDAGTNDVGGVAKEEIQADREFIVNFFLNAGKTVFLLPILARGTGSWTSGGAARAIAHWINEQSKEFADSKRNAYLLDWNKVWVDGNDVDGQPKTDYSGDDVHFDVKGAFAVGKYIADFVRDKVALAPARVNSPDDAFDAVNNPNGCLFANPMCLGTGGNASTGASGDVMDGMTLQKSGSSGGVTVVGSKEVRIDGRGEWQVCTYTLSGTGVSTYLLRTSPASISHSLAGEWAQASVEFEVEANDALTAPPMIYINDLASGGVNGSSMQPYSGYAGGVGRVPNESYKGTQVSQKIKLQPDSTLVRIRVEMYVDSAATVAPVIRHGAIELRKVSSPEIPTPEAV